MMTLPSPPADMSRAERKAFRTLMQRLAENGIEPTTRMGLADQVVRLDARMPALRKAENEAESDRKLAAMRAVNTASTEMRRLNEALFRGARKLAQSEPEDESGECANEAWRDYHWRQIGDRDALVAKYGEPRLTALLFPTGEERAATIELLNEYGNRQPTQTDLDKLRRRFGGKLGYENLMPHQ